MKLHIIYRVHQESLNSHSFNIELNCIIEYYYYCCLFIASHTRKFMSTSEENGDHFLSLARLGLLLLSGSSPTTAMACARLQHATRATNAAYIRLVDDVGAIFIIVTLINNEHLYFMHSLHCTNVINIL